MITRKIQIYSMCEDFNFVFSVRNITYHIIKSLSVVDGYLESYFRIMTLLHQNKYTAFQHASLQDFRSKICPFETGTTIALERLSSRTFAPEIKTETEKCQIKTAVTELVRRIIQAPNKRIYYSLIIDVTFPAAIVAGNTGWKG